MEIIEINASQVAVRHYELASLSDRVLAFVIDVVLMLTFCAGMFFLLKTYYQSDIAESHIYAYCLPFFLGYSLLFESLNKGRSVGKYIMKIRVIKADGKKGTFSDYVARWLFRALDVYLSIGTLAIVMVSLTEHNQRLGDLVANTIVVKE